MAFVAADCPVDVGQRLGHSLERLGLVQRPGVWSSESSKVHRDRNVPLFAGRVYEVDPSGESSVVPVWIMETRTDHLSTVVRQDRPEFSLERNTTLGHRSIRLAHGDLEATGSTVSCS